MESDTQNDTSEGVSGIAASAEKDVAEKALSFYKTEAGAGEGNTLAPLSTP
jgi:hypothetical protein